MPAEYTRTKGLPETEAAAVIRARYAQVVGTLPWYCIDHWTAELGLDLERLKQAHRHRIRYLPGAMDFLSFARRSGKRLVLVTNADDATTETVARVTEAGATEERVVPLPATYPRHVFSLSHAALPFPE